MRPLARSPILALPQAQPAYPKAPDPDPSVLRGVWMDRNEIPFLSVSQVAALIKDRSLSPVDVVESYLDRIDSLNGRLYAYLTVCRDEAIQAARESQAALERGEYLGPMHGVPVAVKDQLNTAGIRTTSGTPIFNDFIPDHDATVVARLKAAGAILMGKLNMTELAPPACPMRSKQPATPGTWSVSPGVPAAGPAAPPRHSCAPRPWVKTPEVLCGAPPPGAGWSDLGPPGDG